MSPTQPSTESAPSGAQQTGTQVPGGNQGSLADASSGKIRNVLQSVQHRDISKQAPDIVAYIDGQNYVLNAFAGDNGTQVPINDYLNSVQCSYDVDSMIPSASLTFVVPNFDDHLFRMPGGMNLLQTMSELRLFAKGSMFSSRGNTVYRQIFRGFLSSINYSMDGKQTVISISAFGALGLLERMQIDMNPALMSSSPHEVTAYTSIAGNMNPYDQIALVFLWKSMIDGFEAFSLQQAAQDNTNPYHKAVEQGFIAKWQALLFDLARDVHVFGHPNVQNVIGALKDEVKYPPTQQEAVGKSTAVKANDPTGTASESDKQDSSQDFYSSLRDYAPDMGFASVQLLNGRVMSRLERLRYLVQLIGFEAYQDIDGGVIVKPPLYNLDVVNVSNPDAPKLDGVLDDLIERNNPFVVQLAEIDAESESEDEAAIRATRLIVQGSYNPAFQAFGSVNTQAIVEDIDVPKLAQFGLRTEPPHPAPFFREGDTKALYAFCSTELARMNRGFRTYSVTIPLRPELKLGFPLYFPHRDMYGYLKSCSISYTQGSDATMSLVLDSIRRRPMFPETQNVPVPGSNQPQKRTFFTPQPNLIMQWTKPPVGDAAPTATADSNAGKLPGQLGTLPLPYQMVFAQQRQMMHYREQVLKNNYTPASDVGTHCWRVQPDTQGVFDHQRKVAAAPTGVPYTPGNDYYEDLRTRRPFTDQKGYELIGTFPWGRWDSLKNALYLFTVSDTLDLKSASTYVSSSIASTAPVSGATDTLSTAESFLFSGESSPATGTEAASRLAAALENQASAIGNFKVFELTYGQGLDSAASLGLADTQLPAPPNDQALNSSSVQARTAAFLNGTPPANNQVQSILQGVHTVQPSGALQSAQNAAEATLARAKSATPTFTDPAITALITREIV